MMTQQTPEYNLMRTPEFTWQWCFNGRWEREGIIVSVEKPACWFHRVMQRLILGIHWRKIEETK